MKLFFSDVDNTLVVKGESFSDELKSCLKLVQDNNDEFVLCSGRPLANLKMIANELRSEDIDIHYVSGFNGGTIYDVVNNQLIYENGLSLSEVERVTITLAELGVDYLLYDEEKIYSNNVQNQWAIFESELTELELVQANKPFASIKVLGLIDPELMLETLAKVKTELAEFTVCNSTPFFIEITKAGVNKGAGLQKMQEYLNVESKNCYAFGDAMNDYEMFKVCENSVCVANAVPEIKAISKLEVEDVKCNGVAKYVKNLYN